MPRIDVNLDGGLNTQDDEYKVGFNGFTTLQNIRQVDGVIAKRYGTGSQNTISSKTIDNVENFVSRRLAGVKIDASSSNYTFSNANKRLNISAITGVEVPGDARDNSGTWTDIFKAGDTVCISGTASNNGIFVIESVDSNLQMTFYRAPVDEPTTSSGTIYITFAITTNYTSPTTLTITDDDSYDDEGYLYTYTTGANKYIGLLNPGDFGDDIALKTVSSSANIHMRAKAYTDAVRFSCGLDDAPLIFRYVNRNHFNGYLKYGNNTNADLLYSRWILDSAVIDNQSSAFSGMELWNGLGNSSNFHLRAFRGGLNLADNVYDYKVIPVFDGNQEMLLDDSVYDFSTRTLSLVGGVDESGYTSSKSTGIRMKGTITLANLNPRVSGLNIYRSTNGGTFYKVKSIYMGDNDPNVKHLRDINRVSDRFYFSNYTAIDSDDLDSKVLMYDGFETVIASGSGSNDYNSIGWKSFTVTDALTSESPKADTNFSPEYYGSNLLCKFNQVSEETETIFSNNGEAIGGSASGGWYIADGTEVVDRLDGTGFDDGTGDINKVFEDTDTPGPFSSAFASGNSSNFHAKFENDGSTQNDSSGRVRLNNSADSFNETLTYVVSGWVRAEGFNSPDCQWRFYLSTDSSANPGPNETGDLVLAEGKGGDLNQNIDNWRYFQYEMKAPGSDSTGNIYLWVRILTPQNWIAGGSSFSTGAYLYLKGLSIRQSVTIYDIGPSGTKPVGFFGKNILADTDLTEGVTSINVPDGSLKGNYYHSYTAGSIDESAFPLNVGGGGAVESSVNGIILDNIGPFIKIAGEISTTNATDAQSNLNISTSNYRFALSTNTASTLSVDFIDPGWVDGARHPFEASKSLDVKHKYATMLNGRQFVANVKIQSEGDTEEYPNFVMFSETGMPDVIPVTNFIQLQDLQGGEIVGIETLMNDIVVFMTRGIFRISVPSNDPSSWSLVEAHPNIGCLGDKAIAKAPNGIYFLAESNIYFLNSGFEAIPIGNPIRDDYQSKSLVSTTADKMRLHYDVKYNRVYLTYAIATSTTFYIYNIVKNIWNTELHSAVEYDEFSQTRNNDTLLIETDTNSKIRNAVDTSEFRDVNGAGSQVAIDMTVKTGKQLLTSLDKNAFIRRVNTITDDGGGNGELNLELSGVTPTVTKNDHLVGVQSTRTSARGKFAQIQISDSTNEDSAKEISKVDVEYE